MNPPNIFRLTSHLYQIRSHPGYGFFVGNSGNRQSIVGQSGDIIIAIIFTPSGELLGEPETIASVADIIKQHPSPVAASQVENLVSEWIVKYCEDKFLHTDSILVYQFAFPELNIGIEDLPEYLVEFMESPETFSEGERRELPESVRLWKEQGQFVFWWGQSYWMDQSGEVTSS